MLLCADLHDTVYYSLYNYANPSEKVVRKCIVDRLVCEIMWKKKERNKCALLYMLHNITNILSYLYSIKYHLLSADCFMFLLHR